MEVSGDLVMIHGPAGDLTAATDDLCVVLRFDAVVRDVPSPSEPLNVRPGSVRNQAVVTFDADPGSGVSSRTVTAAVDTRLV